MTDPASRRMFARMTWIGASLGLAGGILFAVLKGPNWGAGFLMGAAVSLLSLEWWKIIGRSLDGSGKVPIAGSGVVMMLRLPLIAALLYVIVKVTGVASGAVIGGLLVSLAGIVIEVLYEALAQKN